MSAPAPPVADSGLTRAVPDAIAAALGLGSAELLPGLLGVVLLFLAANIVALVSVVALIRVWRGHESRRQIAFQELWEPVMFARMDGGEPIALPVLRRCQSVEWLLLWLRVMAYVRGEAHAALGRLAEEAGMVSRVLELLLARAPWKRLVAIRAAGAMRLADAVLPLRNAVYRGETRIALPALRALLDIDHEVGLRALDRMLGSGRWSPAQITALARESGHDLLPVLTGRLGRAAPAEARQLVRVIERLDDPAALPALRQRLLASHASDSAGTAALLHALAHLGDGDDRRAAAALLAHPHWLVRMQAAYALGRLGEAVDIEALRPLAHDAQWWVRYRAAQALHALCATDPGRFDALIAAEPDRYAREALERVRAENEDGA